MCQHLLIYYVFGISGTVPFALSPATLGMYVYDRMCIRQDGLKLRDCRKAESDICLLGDQTLQKKTHFLQHPELQILVPHPAPNKVYVHIYMCLLTSIYCLLAAC